MTAEARSGSLAAAPLKFLPTYEQLTARVESQATRIATLSEALRTIHDILSAGHGHEKQKAMYEIARRALSAGQGEAK